MMMILVDSNLTLEIFWFDRLLFARIYPNHSIFLPLPRKKWSYNCLQTVVVSSSSKVSPPHFHPHRIHEIVEMSAGRYRPRIGHKSVVGWKMMSRMC